MNYDFNVPDKINLLDYFAKEPVECDVENGYWCYEVTDEYGVSLRFSFDVFERSVQTVLSANAVQVATVSHEGASSMIIDGKVLTCQFSYKGSSAKLTLRVRDRISVEWSSIRSS